MRRIQRMALILALLTPAHSVAAQQSAPRALSLEEALRLATQRSEALRIAEAGIMRAQGQVLQARSQYLPQLVGSVTYTRTLASQFEALRGSAPPSPPPGTPPPPPADPNRYYTPCTRYLAPASASAAERLVGLETYARCSANSGFDLDFSKVGFGSENQYQLGLQGQWTLFSGGRVQSQVSAAGAGRRTAEIELASQRAQLTLSTAEAYFDAALADRLVAIAESSLTQTESVLSQTRLARQVGNLSEFDLLRAQVSRDNQMPQVIQARTQRDLAYLRLKQLIDIPYTEPLDLTTPLADERDLIQLTGNELRATLRADQTPDTAAANRAPVRQVEEALQASQAQLRIARAERIPSITVSTQYGRLAFPATGLPSWGNFLTNWTVSLGASVPLFTGGRLRGDRMVAEAGVREAQARLDQARELAALDTRQSLAVLEQAQAALAASVGTAEQAAKAYSIADVRYREGISTQIELNDARILLQQAAANRAQAVRNLQVARLRIALLRDLPLGTAAGSFGGNPGGFGAPGSSVAPQGGAAGGSRQQQTGTQRVGGSAAASVQPPE